MADRFPRRAIIAGLAGLVVWPVCLLFMWAIGLPVGVRMVDAAASISIGGIWAVAGLLTALVRGE